MYIAAYGRVALLVSLLLALILPAQEEKRLTVYTPQTSFSVPVTDVDGREYVSLTDMVQPLGPASVKVEGNSLKLRFAGDESQFEGGKTKAKVRGKTINLGAPAIVENDLVRVPTAGLRTLLPQLLNSTVDVREQARRIIVAGASTDFTADFQSNPPRLVLHFSRPVNPSIANEPGRLKLTFSKDPVIGAAATQTFGDKLITSAAFSERNGVAELSVAATAPLQASFSDENRTITLAAAPQTAIAAPPRPVPAPVPAPSPAIANTPATIPPAVAKQGTSPPVSPVPSHPRFLVVIDPAHGGDDRGALLAAGVEEKEVTLAFARRLRAALENDGITSVLLRDGDSNISLEQRAIAANTARASIYIAVHAGTVGRGVHVYTARMADTAPKPSAFLPWASAQAAFLDQSKAAADAINAELAKRQIAHAEAPAQLRPLNHVTNAAIAVEFLPNQDGVASLASSKYQQGLCVAVADGVAASRRTQEARK